MKLIPFILLSILFSCGSGSKKLKNVKPGTLQFFETYTMPEIQYSWNAACDTVSNNDTLALQGKVNLMEIGLRGLVHPGTNYMIGYVDEKDRTKVDALLATPNVRACFPEDLEFIWSYGLEEIQRGKKEYVLYAIKVPPGNKALVDGRHIETAETDISQYNQSPVIKITMNKQGAHDWEVMTRENVGRSIAIVFDGRVISCPIVNDAISGGVTEISGNFTEAEAEELAARINAGTRKGQGF